MYTVLVYCWWLLAGGCTVCTVCDDVMMHGDMVMKGSNRNSEYSTVLIK